MKNEMLDVYYDVSYYLDKAKENLGYAQTILNEDLAINNSGYNVDEINNYIDALSDAKDDVDYRIIPEIRNMEE